MIGRKWRIVMAVLTAVSALLFIFHIWIEHLIHSYAEFRFLERYSGITYLVTLLLTAFGVALLGSRTQE
jgi:hypothetical protein